MSWCDNEREHERDGREAFRRFHRSDYEEAKRDRYGDDCKAAFVRGYERAEYDDRLERQQREEQEEIDRQRALESARRRQEEEEVCENQWPL